MTGKAGELSAALDALLAPDRSFDLIRRTLIVAGGHEAVLYYIDGFVKDEITEKLMEYYIKAADLTAIDINLPYTEVDHSEDVDQMAFMVLSGATVLLVDGLPQGLIVDTRQYPTRSISEPENDRVLRGPRDGFTETLLFNTALIRRRIRDPHLVMDIRSIGRLTRTDVVLCYIEGRADPAFVDKMKKKLDGIDIGALNLGQESLAECLIGKCWYNPFPKIRYTERPDAAAAMLMEGSVILLCDNTPSVMILPTSIFDFLQETDDFYFPPFVGTYLRLLRVLVFLVTLFITPIWYLMVTHPDSLPSWLEFVKITDPYDVPVLLQLIIVELTVDGLKLASMNTPNSLSSSFSVVGGLILGDFAVQVGWLIPEVILYMAFVAIANFTQPSYELGYAFKFMRVMMLLASAAAGVWGFAASVLLMLILIATNRTVDGSRGYLYPLIPWNGRAMKRLFTRVRLK